MDNVSIRELRNHGGEVVERVEHGEAVRITRDGRPVAELRPLETARLTLPVLLARFRSLPRMSSATFRSDIDAVIDSSL
jgi:prevent-host-death family protein